MRAHELPVPALLLALVFVVLLVAGAWAVLPRGPVTVVVLASGILGVAALGVWSIMGLEHHGSGAVQPGA